MGERGSGDTYFNLRPCTLYRMQILTPPERVLARPQALGRHGRTNFEALHVGCRGYARLLYYSGVHRAYIVY